MYSIRAHKCHKNCAQLHVVLDNKSPDFGVVGPHIVLNDPSLLSVVTLKMYSNHAFRSGIATDVVSTLMSGWEWDLNYCQSCRKQTHWSEAALQCGCKTR